MKKERVIFIIIFVFLFSIMSFSYIVVEPVKYSFSEKRKLAEFPDIRLSSIGSGEFMSEYEEYIDDHILFRDKWISLSSYFNIFLGKRELNNVIIGDNQLFNKFEYSEEDIEVIEKNITFINKFAEKYNGVLMLIPTTECVMKNKLPKYFNSINQEKIINEIYSSVNIQSIDVSKLLVENKINIDSIYYKTDPHWTMQGSYYGYLGICEQLNIEPIPYKDLTFTPVKEDYMGTIYNKINVLNLKDILYTLDMPDDLKLEIVLNDDNSKVYNSLYFYEYLDSVDNYSVYLGGNNPITRVKSNLNTDKKLLMVKDSFSHTLVPYLINHYSEIVLIDFRYYNMGISNLMETENFDDVIVVYNLNNFKSDKGLIFLSK